MLRLLRAVPPRTWGLRRLFCCERIWRSENKERERRNFKQKHTHCLLHCIHVDYIWMSLLSFHRDICVHQIFIYLLYASIRKHYQETPRPEASSPTYWSHFPHMRQKGVCVGGIQGQSTEFGASCQSLNPLQHKWSVWFSALCVAVLPGHNVNHPSCRTYRGEVLPAFSLQTKYHQTSNKQLSSSVFQFDIFKMCFGVMS